MIRHAIAVLLFAGGAAGPLVAQSVITPESLGSAELRGTADDGFDYIIGLETFSVPLGSNGSSSLVDMPFSASVASNASDGKQGARAAVACCDYFGRDIEFDSSIERFFSASAGAGSIDTITTNIDVQFTANAFVSVNLRTQYTANPYWIDRRLDEVATDIANGALYGEYLIGTSVAQGGLSSGFSSLTDGSGGRMGAIFQSYHNEHIILGSDQSFEFLDTIGSRDEFLAEFKGRGLATTTGYERRNGVPDLTVSRNYEYTVILLAGQTYRFVQGVSCLAELGISSASVPGNSASCDAANSAYWNGVTNVTDLSGNSISNFRLTSASGFDYRYASPLSPAPANPAPGVPEPGTWALLIAGFGLVGGAARRRRRAVAA